MKTNVRTILSKSLSISAVAVVAFTIIACSDDEPAPLFSGKLDPEDRKSDSSDAGSTSISEDAEADQQQSVPTSIGDCDADLNPYAIDPPATDFELQNFRFELKSSTPRSVEGTVISISAIDDPRVVTRAVLIGTGAFLDDGCITRQNGTSYSWEGVACQSEEGTLFNVFLIEPDELVGFSPLIEQDMTIRMSGFEIERFDDFSPGGGYWQDGGDDGEKGQISLWLTDICRI